MNNTLAQKLSENKNIVFMRSVLMSKAAVVVQLLFSIGIIMSEYLFDFAHYEEHRLIVPGVIILALFIALTLFICDNIIATLPSFMFICCISIKCYNSFNSYIRFWWAAIPIVASVLFHFIVYRRKIQIGKLFIPYMITSVVVTLGGLGKITLKEYFSPSSLYYMFGLGFGMLVVYILFSSYLQVSNKYSLKMRISYIMMAAGILCTFMVFYHCFIWRETMIGEFRILYFQWRNNVSTILMLVLPFPFYVSTRKGKHIYFFLGLFEYAAILLSGSRGGTLFATIEVALCVIVLIYTDKRNRVKNLAVITTLTVIACCLIRPAFMFFKPMIERFLEGDGIRTSLIKRAIEDFKSNIILGRGLGYTGNSDIYDAKSSINWYHSSPFQIIGSFGLAGVFAYGYQFVKRCQLLLSNITHFNLTLFISFIGLTMMSTVNPGEFCPVPYTFLVTMFFVVCEKYNASTKSENGNEIDEVLIKL